MSKRVYGRRQGRPLGRERSEAMERIFPALKIDESRLESPESLAPDTLFPAFSQTIWLEIGYGSGENLLGCLDRHPDICFLGAEPFLNGTANFLKALKPEHHDRIRIWPDDGILLVDALESCSLDRIFILNPDPWHKKRHNKRRIVNAENLDKFARILKPGGQLVMSTDIEELALWMADKTAVHKSFRWTDNRESDWSIMPEGWIQTRYEKKGLAAGRTQLYLLFERI